MGCGDDLEPPRIRVGGRLIAPATVSVGRRFPVVFVADDPRASGVVTVEAGGAAALLVVHRGRGVASLVLDRPFDGELGASGERIGAPPVAIAALEREPDVLGSGASELRIADDATVASLTLTAGAVVRLGAGVDLTVTGSLIAEGTAAAPVLFVADDPGAPWAGLHLPPGSTAELDHTWFLDGGGDPAQAFGHSGSQPVVMVERAAFALRGGGIVDSPGKAFGAVDAEVALTDAVIARCDTGGELSRSQLTLRDSHVVEIPDRDGVADDDDNDGVYLQGVRTVDGAPRASIIEGGVFAVGEDDAIDHNGALLAVERVHIEGFRHEGIAASNGGRVDVVDAVIRDCAQGVEVGYGAPAVALRNVLVTDSEVGLRFGDDYDMPCTGTLAASAAVVAGNRDDVVNHVNLLDGPRPGAIAVDCSIVDDPEAVGRDNRAAIELSGDCPVAAEPPPGCPPPGPLSCPGGPP